MSYEPPNTFSILEALLVEKELVDEKRGLEKRSIDWWDMMSKDCVFRIDDAINLRENPKLFVELIKSAAISLAWAEDIYKGQDEKRSERINRES